MYNDSRSYLNRRNILTLIAAIVILCVVFFVATHGFLAIKNNSKNDSFSYTSYGGDLAPTSSNLKGSFKTLASGDYSIQIPLAGGGIDTRFVKVPRFLTTIETEKLTGENKTEVLGRGVLPRLALSGERLAGWSEDGNVQPIDQNKVDNSETPQSTRIFFPRFDQVVQVDGSWIGGFTVNDDKDRTITPSYYNFTKDDNYPYPSFPGGERPIVHLESRGFSIYSSTSKTFNLYKPSQKDVVSLKYEKEPISTYDEIPLYSISEKRTAVVTGGDTTSANEDENKEVKGANLKVRILNTKDNKQIIDKGFGKAVINNVILSPNGTNVYIKTNQSSALYTTDDMKPVYATPFIVNDFMWIDDDTFTYTTTEHGMFIGSVRNGHARTIAPQDVINPTQLSYVSDGMIYFTAYTSTTEGSVNPDAYRVAVNTAASTQDKDILRNFPKQGDGFYVDYINGKLIVRLVRYVSSAGSFEDSGAKTAAGDYIAETFTEDIPPVVYDYIISDLRVKPTSED